MPSTVAPRTRRLANLLPILANDGMAPTTFSPAVGPAAAARCGRSGAPRSPALSRDDRHLGEHAVPAGVRAAQAHAWNCCCRWPGPTRCRSTNSSAPRRPAIPRVHAQPVRPARRDHLAAHPAARRAAGVQAVLVPAGRDAEPEPQHPRGLRVAVRAVGPAAPGARRARRGADGRARRPSSTPGCRTGSATRATGRRSSSACSGRRASGCTSGRVPGRRERPFSLSSGTTGRSHR